MAEGEGSDFWLGLSGVLKTWEVSTVVGFKMS